MFLPVIVYPLFHMQMNSPWNISLWVIPVWFAEYLSPDLYHSFSTVCCPWSQVTQIQFPLKKKKKSRACLVNHPGWCVRAGSVAMSVKWLFFPLSHLPQGRGLGQKSALKVISLSLERIISFHRKIMGPFSKIQLWPGREVIYHLKTLKLKQLSKTFL